MFIADYLLASQRLFIADYLLASQRLCLLQTTCQAKGVFVHLLFHSHVESSGNKIILPQFRISDNDVFAGVLHSR